MALLHQYSISRSVGAITTFVLKKSSYQMSSSLWHSNPFCKNIKLIHENTGKHFIFVWFETFDWCWNFLSKQHSYRDLLIYEWTVGWDIESSPFWLGYLLTFSGIFYGNNFIELIVGLIFCVQGHSIIIFISIIVMTVRIIFL